MSSARLSRTKGSCARRGTSPTNRARPTSPRSPCPCAQLFPFGFSRGAVTAQPGWAAAQPRHPAPGPRRPDPAGLGSVPRPDRATERRGRHLVPSLVRARDGDPLHRGVGHSRRPEDPGPGHRLAPADGEPFPSPSGVPRHRADQLGVRAAFHALAIGEQRSAFRPTARGSHLKGTRILPLAGARSTTRTRRATGLPRGPRCRACGR
jgi:hypothetical protein